MKANDILKKQLFLIFRILFGIIFIFSGIIKLINLNDFYISLEHFNILDKKYLSIFVIIIPSFEIIMGLLLSFGYKTMIISQLISIMLTFFTAIITEKLIEGDDVSCGCFGPLSENKINEFTIIRNLILLFLSILLYICYKKYKPLLINTNQDETRELSAKPARKYTSLSEFWGSMGKILIYFLFFFFVIEILVLSKQNIELKSRLMLLTGKNEYLKVGDIVPSFKAKNLSGDEILIDYQNKHTNTLLFIFSASCNYCKRNIPYWISLSNSLKELDIINRWISLDSLSNTINFIHSQNINYEIFIPSDTLFRHYYKPVQIPVTILIDTSGSVKYIWKGALDSLKKEDIITKLKSIN